MAELMDFQVEGVHGFLAGRRRQHGTAFLGDYPGLGKSVQAIRAAHQVEARFIHALCPAHARTDWHRKMAEWWPDYTGAFDAWSYEGALAGRKALRALAAGAARPRVLFLDEAQYLKTPTAKRTRAVYGGHCRGFGGIVEAFDYVWPLSGTYMPNGDPREMWPHLRALAPYLIINPDTGKPFTYSAFGNRYCQFVEQGFGYKLVGLRNEEEFKEILKRFLLARLPDVAGLPPLRFELHPLDAKAIPTALAEEQWPELAPTLRAILHDAARGDLDAQMQMQLGTLRRFTGMLKVEPTVELVAGELRDGTHAKMGIMAYSVDVVKAIADRLTPFGVSAIWGEVPHKERWRRIDAFQNGPNRVFVGQLIAAGTNLTLTAADQVVFPETDWVADNNIQPARRFCRIGSERPVLARILFIPGTIDELLQRANRSKIVRQLQLSGT